MEIIIAQVICLAAAIGLLVIAYDLDSLTSPIIRYGLLALSVAFVGVFGASFHNPDLYKNAAAIAFTGVGVMAIAFAGYVIRAKHLLPAVLKVSGGALVLVIMLYAFGSCKDKKETKTAGASTPAAAPTVETSDSTQKAIDDFYELSKEK